MMWIRPSISGLSLAWRGWQMFDTGALRRLSKRGRISKNGLKSLQEALSRPPKGKVVAFAYLQVEISEDGKQIMGIEGMSGPLLSLWYLAKALEAKIEGQIEKVAPSMCLCEACQISAELKLTAEFGQEVH